MSEQKPHIAILGAGPVGLDAALAASEAGYPFTVYEARSRVAGNIRDWGHVRLFSPWSLDASPRMRRALAAAERPAPPDDDNCPTGRELVETLLQPVADLPELRPHVRTGAGVVAVSREGLLKSDAIGSPERGSTPFRILLRSREGEEWVERAAIVLDCTGTYGNPNALGDGGIPAPGEVRMDRHIVRRIPDVRASADDWAGRTVLLVGGGHSAQTAARDLAALAEKAGNTRVIWALRNPEPDFGADAHDPLPERYRLSARAQALAEGASDAVEAVPGVVVEALEEAGGRVAVTLRDRSGEMRKEEVDRVLALTGGVGDHHIYRQLQVHECWATQGPMKLAAALIGASAGADCLDQESHGADTLVNPEPDFFILGDKSYGRNNTFLMRIGWQQVDEVFQLLGPASGSGRADSSGGRETRSESPARPTADV